MGSPIPSGLTGCALTLLALLTMVPARVDAGLGEPDGRVRTVDKMSRRVLDEGLARSATLRRLVAELERTDLIVYVRTAAFYSIERASTVLTAVTDEARYLRVSLHSKHSREALIALLAHELQHALELAAATEVRTERTFVEFYRRIGFDSQAREKFETRAATETTTAVRRELLEPWEPKPEAPVLR
jgi:hypothetical protein